MLLDHFRCLLDAFFFPHNNFLSFLISLYQLLAAERHRVQLISWPKQGLGGKPNPTATLLCVCVSSITALLGKQASCYPCCGIVGTPEVKCQQDISCVVLKLLASAFCGWMTLLRQASTH